jgi:hypothetical protein
VRLEIGGIEQYSALRIEGAGGGDAHAFDIGVLFEQRFSELRELVKNCLLSLGDPNEGSSLLVNASF